MTLSSTLIPIRAPVSTEAVLPLVRAVERDANRQRVRYLLHKLPSPVFPWDFVFCKDLLKSLDITSLCGSPRLPLPQDSRPAYKCPNADRIHSYPKGLLDRALNEFFVNHDPKAKRYMTELYAFLKGHLTRKSKQWPTCLVPLRSAMFHSAVEIQFQKEMSDCLRNRYLKSTMFPFPTIVSC